MSIIQGYLLQNNENEHIIFTDKIELFSSLQKKYPYLTYPQNYEFMTTKQLYQYFQTHQIDEDFALFNLKVLEDRDIHNGMDYMFGCYCQTLNLIQKFEKIYQRKFRTLDVDKVLSQLYSNFDIENIFNDNGFEILKYSNDNTLSDIELLVLFYISLYISLMIEGKNQQINIDSRKMANIPCMTIYEAKNFKFNSNELNDFVSNTIEQNKVMEEYSTLMNNLFNSIDTYFDIDDIENQKYLYLCTLLQKKLHFALNQYKLRTIMLQISDFQINNNYLLVC